MYDQVGVSDAHLMTKITLSAHICLSPVPSGVRPMTFSDSPRIVSVSASLALISSFLGVEEEEESRRAFFRALRPESASLIDCTAVEAMT